MTPCDLGAHPDPAPADLVRAGRTPKRFSFLCWVSNVASLVRSSSDRHVRRQARTRWPTLAGALLVLAGLWLATRTRPAALTLLIAGALLPALTAWWSLAIPATALLILLCGTLAIRATARSQRRPRVSTGDLGPNNTDGRS
jgi:hypothetical protein